MTFEVKVQTLPESVADATVSKWYKQPGDNVASGEPLVDLETDKVMLEIVAPEGGVLTEIVAAEGATVVAGEILGKIGASGADTAVKNVQKSWL